MGQYITGIDYQWPQDTLAVPNGGGSMPPIETANRDVDRRQSFTLVGEVNYPGASPINTIRNLSLPTDADGDFWVNQIYLSGVSAKAGGLVNDIPPGTVTFTDVRTGKSMMWPEACPLDFFRGAMQSEESGFNVGETPFPNGFRSTGTLIQPWCFTRNGGIQIQFVCGPIDPTDNFTLSIGFAGWKEYAHASQ